MLPWFSDDYPGVGQPLFECVQEPGDIVYVPEDYGHAVLNMEESLAIAGEMIQA